MHNRLPEDYWDRYPAEIAKVEPDAIQRAAKKYLDPQHLQVVCVGSGKEIKDTLTKYGPVEVYDVNGRRSTQRRIVQASRLDCRRSRISGAYQRPYLLSDNDFPDVSPLVEIENNDGQVVVLAQGDGS